MAFFLAELILTLVITNTINNVGDNYFREGASREIQVIKGMPHAKRLGFTVINSYRPQHTLRYRLIRE